MALHPDFPASPYVVARPDQRWFPAPEDQRSTAYEKLLPPLVAQIRDEVSAWRAAGYAGASATSRALLQWWFAVPHQLEQADGSLATFQYYFAQREAVETAIWLYDVKRARDKYDLMRFDASGAVSASMFPEDWPRYVIKMATGSGKTKVLSLLIAWCYFHKVYEVDSPLARNILLIAPNIIVLDRLRADFDGLKIFFNDPVLPDNGIAGRNWRDDFQMTLHVQDDVRVVRPIGNLFLTNIHRVYLGDVPEPSLDDEDLRNYFLAPFGPKPVGKTTDSHVDLGEVVREIDELAVFNDEAHHVHDPRMAWFGSIADIHHRMLQKDGRLALQIDVTATPKHDNGAIFVQTVSDYPLVEAIHQNVVKHPVLPDQASLARLNEAKSAIFTERYADYLKLGIEEWRKSCAEHAKLGKKAVLFVMVDDTRNCDEVGAWLEKTCSELAGAVLVIHTKQNGEISEVASGKKKVELDELRARANAIDAWDSPYKAIVSVLVLKEGWDVQNVTTIVGLRAYASKANILPEQTLGRGLRRMYFGQSAPEFVSVMGTHAFVEFVETIKSEGVELEHKPMGGGAERADSLVVEVDNDNRDKDIAVLDIVLPRLTRRFQRESRDLAMLDAATVPVTPLPLKPFPEEETRHITFKLMLDDSVHHSIDLTPGGPADYRSVVAFYARQLRKDLHLGSVHDQLYPCVRDFMRDRLFESGPVDLEDPVVLRNIAEPEAGKLIYDGFTKAINALTVQAVSDVGIDGWLHLSDMRPFRTGNREYLIPRRSPFNKIVGEPNAGGLELAFASFLDGATDVASFAKNYQAVGFKVDYVKANGELSTYTPDFIVRTTDGTVWLIETKGRAELDVPQKMARLAQWCVDASAVDPVTTYHFVYVDEKGFNDFRPADMAALAASFRDYQPEPDAGKVLP